MNSYFFSVNENSIWKSFEEENRSQEKDREVFLQRLSDTKGSFPRNPDLDIRY